MDRIAPVTGRKPGDDYGYGTLSHAAGFIRDDITQSGGSDLKLIIRGATRHASVITGVIDIRDISHHVFPRK